MAEHISWWGKLADEILTEAAQHVTPGSLSARISLRDFKHTCDFHGHIIPLELPGAICGFLRAQPGCLYAEVQRLPNHVGAVIVGVFETEATLKIAVANLSSHTFTLDYGLPCPPLLLPCPPLEISTGSLNRVLGMP